MKRNLFAAPLLLAVACAPQAAQQSDDPRPARASMRAIHIARGAPPLAVTYDAGIAMAQGVRFSGMTRTVEIDAGAHDFDVVAAGSAVATAAAALHANDRATLVMWGNLEEMHATTL